MSESFKAVFISSEGWTHDVIIIWLRWVDHAAANMSVLTVGAWAFSSFGYLLRRKAVGSHGSSMRNVFEDLQPRHRFPFSSEHTWDPALHTLTPALFFLPLFLFSWVKPVQTMWTGLCCPIVSDAEHTFICSAFICIAPLEKLSPVLCPFLKIGLFFFIVRMVFYSTQISNNWFWMPCC